MFENRGSINDSSIGIEIVNLGFQRKVHKYSRSIKKNDKKAERE